MTRLLLDTNVLVSALIEPRGPSARIVSMWRAGSTLDVIVSAPLLEEVRETLGLPRLRRFLERAGLDERVALAYAAELGSRGVWIDVDQDQVVEGLRDPADAHVLAAADAGGADFVVTGDCDLLAMGRFKTIMIVSPRDFLARTALAV